MNSEIQTFISSINKYQDLQRQSRFKVFFPTIPGCPTLADLTLRCESVDLPGRSFNTFDHRTYGPILKYPTQSFFNEITLTFLCSSNRQVAKEIIEESSGMDEKTTFENWMNYINTYPEASSRRPDQVYHNFRYRNEYVAPINIICYDTGDDPSYKMELEDAYPLSVSPVSMTWGSEEVARVSVTFTYTYFRYTKMCEIRTSTQTLYTTTQQEIPRKSEAQKQGPPITPEVAETIPEVAQEYGAGLVQPGVGPIGP